MIFRNTYNPVTHKDKNGDAYLDLLDLTDKLSGPNSLDFSEPIKENVKNWFRSTFDVNLMLNYITLVNFAGSWDGEFFLSFYLFFILVYFFLYRFFYFLFF